MKILMVDLETSGLDPSRHEILEIGAVLFDDTTFEVLGTMTEKVKPTHIETAEPIALDINGYTKEAWENAISLDVGIGRLLKFGEGAIFCSFPLLFDYSFIQAARKDAFVGRYKLDLMSMAYAKVPSKFLSLKQYCLYLDIDPEPKMHRSLNGALCAYNVYKALLLPAKQPTL